MSPTFHLECPECGEWWGPYAGTTWRTPREQGLCALGGIEHEHDVDVTDLRPV
jgi:hypothetical protein